MQTLAVMTTLSIVWELEESHRADFEAFVDVLLEIVTLVNSRPDRTLRMMVWRACSPVLCTHVLRWGMLKFRPANVCVSWSQLIHTF